MINLKGNLGHFAVNPCVPRFKFALRGAFARQIERKLIKRDETLRGLSDKHWGNPAVVLCSKCKLVSSQKKGFLSEPSPDTESTRMSGGPDTVASSKQ